MDDTLKELGRKIRNARKELGFNRREDFAKAVSLPVFSIKKIEKGEVPPPLTLIHFLCNKLKVPPRAFIYGRIKDNNFLFRGRKKYKRLSEVDKVRIAVIKDLIETLIEFGKAHYNRFDFTGNPNPEIAAREFIETYNLNKEDFNTWKVVMPLLSQKNIFVFGIPLQSQSAVVHDSEPFFIVFNSEEPADRWSFSLLHEIGHFVAPEEEKNDEAYADSFAGNVLIPEGMRYKLWRELESLIKKRWYRRFFTKVRNMDPLISPEAVFLTLIKTFYANPDFGRFAQFRKTAQKLRQEERQSGKPIYQNGKILYPRIVLEKLKELLSEGKITLRRYQELTMQL